jgi:predicted RNase H-like HicB family nuclease
MLSPKICTLFASTFASTPEMGEIFLGTTELPTGFGEVGSLLQAVIRLEIPSCGTPTIVSHRGMRYIQPSQGCPPETLQRLHHTYKTQVEALARKHGVTIDRKNLGVTIERLRKKDVHVPEPHSCQTGDLWLGPHHSNRRRVQGGPDDRPPWIVDAAKKLMKGSYSLLFSLIDLVTEPRPGDPLDAWVAPEKVLEWCTMYGLPVTEESQTDEPDGGMRLDTFQRETAILYALYHLWKALIEWQDFKAVSGPSDPEEAERHRRTIHHYASLLPGYGKGGSLRVFVALEQDLKRLLDGGNYEIVDPKTKKTVDVKEAYKGAQAKVDYEANLASDEVVHARRQGHQYLSGATAQIILLAPSVFDACYFQLGQLRLRSPGEVARHLKLCAVQSCGRVFWAEDGHEKFCGRGNHNRGAQWIAQERVKAKARPKQQGARSMTFIVTLEEGEDGYIIAECPALPGCMSQGKTREEALANIREAIQGIIKVRRQYGLPIPVETLVEVEVPA